ncbi:hypothetical protein BKA70DRAFT_360677 [Coprinopsis sp. MPI-PUGE-AT-0042]|nr:hypothetical protein BKA70DRAFT_360677 [Coprinopsis sp. MPI-PUGE-AT-0042]
MDIAGLILNLVGVARGIHTFLDETKSKKEKFRQLEWRVLSLIEILSPLASRNQSKALLHLQERYQIGIIFMELAEILGCIRERILAHNNHSGFGGIMDFVNPTVLLGKLEDDEKRLSRWIEIFGLHLQIAQRLSCISQQPTSSLAVARAERVRRVNDHVRTTDVARFWNNCIGMEIKHVTPAVFFVAMNGWLRRRLEDVEYASIYLEFDPEDSGIVTKARVFQVVGSLPLGTFVYEHERRACRSRPSFRAGSNYS